MAIEGDATIADRNFDEGGSDLAIEAIAVHPKVAWRVSVPQESGLDHDVAPDQLAASS